MKLFPLKPQTDCLLTFYAVFVSQVNLGVTDSRALGIMIRGGNEFGLGIYITGLDRGSLAEQAGLKVSGGHLLMYTKASDRIFRNIWYKSHATPENFWD